MFWIIVIYINISITEIVLSEYSFFMILGFEGMIVIGCKLEKW